MILTGLFQLSAPAKAVYFTCSVQNINLFEPCVILQINSIYINVFMYKINRKYNIGYIKNNIT